MARTAPALGDIPLEGLFELVERLDVRGPRYTSYPTVPAWQDDVDDDDRDRALAQTRRAGQPVALYVHLPFCRSRCLYCGCNSFITARADRMQRYGDALLREIDAVATALAGLEHQQLHLGGGTPTHLPVEMLAAICDRLIDRLPGAPGAERSIEVDPRVTTDEHLQMLAERGFRRLSAGVQDLDQTVQQAVNRVYSRQDLASFVARARAAGLAEVNLDLIYGLPEQTPQSWLATLEAIHEIGPDRLACFGYAHLPQRMRHQQAIDETRLPTPRERLNMLVDAIRFFTERGYEAIGLDHFARPHDELAVARREGRLWRNFMGYTTTRGLELVGVGSSAISELAPLFVQNEVAPERYAERIERRASTIVRGHRLDDDDRHRKLLVNHLMCNLEVDLTPPAAASEELASALAAARVEIGRFVGDGLVEPTAVGYRVTPLGQLFLRNLAMPLDRYLPRQGGTTFSRTV
ncbi:MAG: oxygen-independent coproporphyrinogen III oxidase [Deltaproteobacteria bacterium]|jgi:oxygen-independent coproporphyrinogen-3 oxidase|nr:oxygen-independent coproporphyrinogen III oxidase [Deltaproteobacteria bacterium]MBW2535500.1 oxygen-independent coproporphyrinogen III oxidase [Deltaproteobacteria bacterium]